MRKCCVPGCFSNYAQPYVPTFLFPKDEHRRKLWERNIGKQGMKISNNVGVCIKHFLDDYIIRLDKTEADGEVTMAFRRTVKLKKDAVPSIFPSVEKDDEDVPEKKRRRRTLSKGMRMKRQKLENEVDLVPNVTAKSSLIKVMNKDSVVKELSQKSCITNRPIITVLKAEETNETDIDACASDDKSPFEEKGEDDASSEDIIDITPDTSPVVSTKPRVEEKVTPAKDKASPVKRSLSVGSNSSTGSNETSKLITSPVSKRRKVEKPPPTVIGKKNDVFCWVCHKDPINISCFACKRSYHQKCAGETESQSNWLCPECVRLLDAENLESRSSVLAELSTEKFCTLLKYCLNRLKCRAPAAFHQPVPVEYYKNYLDFVIHPMDLSLIEKNIKQKRYGCTESFLADVKWIQHNSAVFNGALHPLTVNARTLVRTAEADMNEISVCPDCFVHTTTKPIKYWFSDVCSKPHPVVWAKLKGFPYWPAKIVQTLGDAVDARFFGAHDRAWVPISQCFHLSKEMPTSSKPKKKGYDDALIELNVHVKLLEEKYGHFEYAPYRTPFNPNNVRFAFPEKKDSTGALKKNTVVNGNITDRTDVPNGCLPEESCPVPIIDKISLTHTVDDTDVQVLEYKKLDNGIENDIPAIKMNQCSTVSNCNGEDESDLKQSDANINLSDTDLPEQSVEQKRSADSAANEKIPSVLFTGEEDQLIAHSNDDNNNDNNNKLEFETKVLNGSIESANVEPISLIEDHQKIEVDIATGKVSEDDKSTPKSPSAPINSLSSDTSSSSTDIKESKSFDIANRSFEDGTAKDSAFSSNCDKIQFPSGNTAVRNLNFENMQNSDFRSMPVKNCDQENSLAEAVSFENSPSKNPNIEDLEKLESVLKQVKEMLSEDNKVIDNENHTSLGNSEAKIEEQHQNKSLGRENEDTKENTENKDNESRVSSEVKSDEDEVLPSLSSSKKLDFFALKLGKTIESCKAKLGITELNEEQPSSGSEDEDEEEEEEEDDDDSDDSEKNEEGSSDVENEESSVEEASTDEDEEEEEEEKDCTLEPKNCDIKLVTGETHESSVLDTKVDIGIKANEEIDCQESGVTSKSENVEKADSKSEKIKLEKIESFNQNSEAQPIVSENLTFKESPAKILEQSKQSSYSENSSQDMDSKELAADIDVSEIVLNKCEESKEKGSALELNPVISPTKAAVNVIEFIDLSSSDESEDMELESEPIEKHNVSTNPLPCTHKDSVDDLHKMALSNRLSQAIKPSGDTDHENLPITSFKNCLQKCNENCGDNSDIHTTTPSSVDYSTADDQMQMNSASPKSELSYLSSPDEPKSKILNDTTLKNLLITDVSLVTAKGNDPSELNTPNSVQASKENSSPKDKENGKDFAPHKRSLEFNSPKDIIEIELNSSDDDDDEEEDEDLQKKSENEALNVPDIKNEASDNIYSHLKNALTGNVPSTVPAHEIKMVSTDGTATGCSNGEKVVVSNESMVTESPNVEQTLGTDSDLLKEIKNLRMELQMLKSKCEIQEWFSNQSLTEQKHCMNLVILEMRASLETDKKITIETQRKDFELEKTKAVEETKDKQWCAVCKSDAIFLCCWNASYCSHECQKQHWPQHRYTCTQLKVPSSLKNSGPEFIKITKKPTSEMMSPKIQLVATKNQLQMLSPPTSIAQGSAAPVSFLPNKPVQILLTPVPKVIQDSSDLITKVRSRQTDLNTAIQLLNKMNKETEATLKKKELIENVPEDIPSQSLQQSDHDSSTKSAADDLSDDALVIDENDDDDENDEMVELNYGVEISKKKLKMCQKLGTTPTRLARSLLDVLFPDSKVLADSCVFGRKSNVTKKTRPALKLEEVNAIIDYVLSIFPSAQKTELVLAMNLKCKEARRAYYKTNPESQPSNGVSTEGEGPKPSKVQRVDIGPCLQASPSMLPKTVCTIQPPISMNSSVCVVPSLSKPLTTTIRTLMPGQVTTTSLQLASINKAISHMSSPNNRVVTIPRLVQCAPKPKFFANQPIKPKPTIVSVDSNLLKFPTNMFQVAPISPLEKNVFKPAPVDSQCIIATSSSNTQLPTTPSSALNNSKLELSAECPQTTILTQPVLPLVGSTDKNQSPVVLVEMPTAVQPNTVSKNQVDPTVKEEPKETNS